MPPLTTRSSGGPDAEPPDPAGRWTSVRIQERCRHGRSVRIGSRMTGLNPIPAIVIYWNTAHLGETTRHRKHAGLTVEPEILAHISLPGRAHIPFTGECRWPKRVSGLSVRFCPLPESTRGSRRKQGQRAVLHPRRTTRLSRVVPMPPAARVIAQSSKATKPFVNQMGARSNRPSSLPIHPTNRQAKVHGSIGGQETR